MYDKNLLLRDGSTALSASEQANAASDFGAGDREAITYEAVIPSASGTTPTCDIKIQESDDGTVWRDFLAFQQITAAGVYRASGRSDARYRRAYITLGGTTPGFGNALIGPVTGGLGTSW